MLIAKKKIKIFQPFQERRERSLLDEKLLKTIPLVNEANAIADELGKSMRFSIKLMANQARPAFSSDGDSITQVLEFYLYIFFFFFFF